MEKMTDDVPQQSTDAATRRTFLGTLSKMALGAAAVVAGIGSGAAHAAAEINIGCCTGPKACYPKTCPAGTYPAYAWVCCSGRLTYECVDCRSNSNNTLVCVYNAFEGDPC